jgi:hypothetical protein
VRDPRREVVEIVEVPLVELGEGVVPAIDDPRIQLRVRRTALAASWTPSAVLGFDTRLSPLGRFGSRRTATARRRL